MASYTRQTALPCTIAELKGGAFIQMEDKPSGVESPRGLVSRASIYGVLVEKDAAGFLLDDGSGQLKVRSFESREFPDVGQFCLVVGRPREYNNERYLAVEICKNIPKEWMAYRKQELSMLQQTPPSLIQEQPEPNPVQVPDEGKNPFETIIACIKELDDGHGAPIEDVMSAINHPEKTQLFQTLIEEGEIFEIRPGLVKVLE